MKLYYKEKIYNITVKSKAINYNPVQKELRHCVYFNLFSFSDIFVFFPPSFQCCHGCKMYWKILHTQH